MKVLFLTRSLETGGAERQLTVLACGLARRGHTVQVASFYPGGAFAPELARHGVAVHDLEKGGRWDTLAFLRRLADLIARERPEVLYSFLGTPNVMAALVRPFVPLPRLAWSIRASNTDLKRHGWPARISYAIERRLARRPDVIIANSHAGADHAVGQGFPAERIVVVPNGFDTQRFRPERALGLPLREAWGIAPAERVVGYVGRLDPVKDYEGFLAAASRVADPRTRFVIVGDGPPAYRAELQALGQALGLNGRLVWAGEVGDMPVAYNAFDVAVLSSYAGEGFPNTLGEAMACGVPCVTTDVGDASRIVADTGLVVPTRSPEALARALEQDLSSLGARARERVLAHYSIDQAVLQTETALAP